MRLWCQRSIGLQPFKTCLFSEWEKVSFDLRHGVGAYEVLLAHQFPKDGERQHTRFEGVLRPMCRDCFDLLLHERTRVDARCGPGHASFILRVEAREVGNMGAFAPSEEGSRRIW